MSVLLDLQIYFNCPKKKGVPTGSTNPIICHLVIYFLCDNAVILSYSIHLSLSYETLSFTERLVITMMVRGCGVVGDIGMGLDGGMMGGWRDDGWMDGWKREGTYAREIAFTQEMFRIPYHNWLKKLETPLLAVDGFTYFLI